MIEITMQNYAAFSGKPTSTYAKTFACLAEAARWYSAPGGLATPVRVTVDGTVVAEGAEASLVYLESLSGDHKTSMIKVGVIIDGADALQTYREGVGQYPLSWPPAIPAGCNTAWWRFETRDGRPALVIRQSGFTRARGEGEVNGISVAVALDGCGEEAYAALEKFVGTMLPEAAENG